MSIAKDAGRPPEHPLVMIPGGTGTPVPEPPEHLTAYGRAVWARLWLTGRSWLSNDAHFDLMAMLVDAIERRDTVLAPAARKARVTVKGSMGQQRVNPIYDQLARLEAQIADLLKRARFEPDAKRQPVEPRKRRSRLSDLDADG